MAADPSSVSLRPEPLGEVSVVVPTYQEAENIERLVQKVEDVLKNFERGELIFVDDNSRDGTEELVEKLKGEGRPWLRLIVRQEERGLSTAVIRGFKEAQYQNLVCMDGDLSHPPEKITELISTLESKGTDFVIGSRYVEGGQVFGDWSLFRWLNSKISTLLARPFTKAQDPMSGFFALKKDRFQKADPLSPLGYKIGLELLVKCHCENVREVPIYFGDRFKGSSKIENKIDHTKEVVRYLRHIKRLSDYKFGNLSHFIQFCIVGGSGTIVNVLAVTIFMALGAPTRLAVILGIITALTSNFFLNRTVTFRDAKKRSLPVQYLYYFFSCSAGNFLNYIITVELISRSAFMAEWPQLAVVVGVISGTVFNFMASRYWTFKKETPAAG